MDTETLRRAIAQLMPEVLVELGTLVRIPSISFPRLPGGPVHQMAERTLRSPGDVGFSEAALPDVPSGYSPVVGEVAGRRLADGDPLLPLRRAARPG